MAQKRPDDLAEPASGPASAKTRIDGIDAARALAVFGMFVVHLGVDSMGLLSPENYAWDLHGVVRGNSSALFAFLAGVSLAMMTGRTRPISGEPLFRSVVRIVTRAVLIALLGLILDMMAVPVAVILTYYGGFFLLALPLVKLRSGALWTVAGVLAVVGPPLSFLLRDAFFPAVPRTGALTSFTEFFLTGYYPAVTFMVFVIAGMAVGRLDLTATGTRLRLLVGGAVAAACGHLGSWLALGPLGGMDRLMEVRAPELLGAPLSTITDPTLVEELRYLVRDEAESISGQVPTDSWWWLAVNTPHTGTTFEILEAIGQGLVVMVLCMWLCDRARIIMYPLTSVGRMPLTVYTGHLVALALIISAVGYEFHTPWLLEQFVLWSLVLATLWRLVVGRGPAEIVLGEAADGAVRLVDSLREDRR
ncbi:heparan-alpha-glucosaminide N-acetyltransferase domain-containing protein [Nocardiopsis lambiniae]|uniref:Heparan-alpha-glucosaminide N-acetyltransferase domain-containing protein n=1 Tax=Nocardiopsis lambiniae TaxID=3075539 RepID=A0ABU2M7T8_9ACTN|nr:heparan-alpha-glucosaminide N-acetyltransferase domain-containing protein [Nocardiopsis sp. DSM 44743]MDT0328690.1 heparan-alpha-glucosaminide N-acetyltransferase domain-containing protein [Nocardiopsis sp. DSM 44743]